LTFFFFTSAHAEQRIVLLPIAGNGGKQATAVLRRGLESKYTLVSASDYTSGC
jgi:hypothetical protein